MCWRLQSHQGLVEELQILQTRLVLEQQEPQTHQEQVLEPQRVPPTVLERVPQILLQIHQGPHPQHCPFHDFLDYNPQISILQSTFVRIGAWPRWIAN
jgi:hypothetical protein